MEKPKQNKGLSCTSFSTGAVLYLQKEEAVELFEKISRRLKLKKIKHYRLPKPRSIPVKPYRLLVMKKTGYFDIILMINAYPSLDVIQRSIKEIKKMADIEENQIKKREILSYSDGLESHLKPHLKKNKSCLNFEVSISSERTGEKIKAIDEIISALEKEFELLISEIEKYEVKNSTGRVRGTVAFDPDFYQSIIPLPFSFTMDDESIEKSLGTPEVYGLDVKFDDSKIGLEDISMIWTGELVEMSLSLSFPMVISKDMLKESYYYMGEEVIGKLLSEEVKE